MESKEAEEIARRIAIQVLDEMDARGEEIKTVGSAVDFTIEVVRRAILEVTTSPKVS